MNNYQERVHKEKEELDSRIEKLGTFLTGPVWLNLGVIDQELLRDQLYVMKQYALILDQRIERFK